MQLRQKKDQLESLGIQVVAIAPDLPEKMARLHSILKLPFPLLGDPEKSVFADYGLIENNQPAGGNFMIDREGTLRYMYYGVTPDDRPAMSALMEAARAVAGREIP